MLFLNNRDPFGNIGNQINSLVHAYDYARDHRLDLGTGPHSWAVSTIQSMFFETKSLDGKELSQVMEKELGIKVFDNTTQWQLQQYEKIYYVSSKELFFYRSSPDNYNGGRDWTGVMDFHISILRRLFRRYNQGYGYDHSGSRTKDVCSTLEDFFHSDKNAVRYSVIHSRYLEGRAEFKLLALSRTSNIDPRGAMEMTPKYVRSILTPLGMHKFPIILLSDGQLPAVEERLLKDPLIGPQLIVMSNKASLDGADVVLSVLSNVFIGNPASVTSGFIARARYALGYKRTYMFQKEGLDGWHSVCGNECIFNPNIMQQLV